MVTTKTGNSPLHPSMRQRNPPTLPRSAEEDGGSHSSGSCFNHCNPPSAVSSPQIDRDWSVWSRKLNICFGSKFLFRHKIRRKNITKSVSTMDRNPLSAAFTASVVFMINKLTGTSTVIARKAGKHGWLSKGFCCGCLPLHCVFSCVILQSVDLKLTVDRRGEVKY